MKTVPNNVRDSLQTSIYKYHPGVHVCDIKIGLIGVQFGTCALTEPAVL